MARSNASLAANLLLIALGMLALAYASVPLYRLFCEVTGYGGTTQEATHAPGAVAGKTLTITFNADIDPQLDWEFRPAQLQMKVRVGEQSLTHYVAHNRSKSPVAGHAVYNVVPHAAGRHFVKIDCFCFEEQTLPANARVDMPVMFYIDPAILDDPDLKRVHTITLSYTFFPVRK